MPRTDDGCLCCCGPNTGAHQASKRQAAKHFLGSEDAVDSLPSWAICCCAGGSSAAAAAITNPVDVVKIRLQVMHVNAAVAISHHHTADAAMTHSNRLPMNQHTMGDDSCCRMVRKILPDLMSNAVVAWHQVLSAQRGRMITTRQVARDLWMRERWRGLFAGTHARILAIAPEAAISWALYEMIMQRHIAASAS